MKLTWMRPKDLEKYGIRVTYPEDIEVTFSSIYGLDTAKENLKDLVNYFTTTSYTAVVPHKSYFITGDQGLGKSSLCYAVAKESDIPIISLECNVFVICEAEEVEKIIHAVFNTAKKLSYDYGGSLVCLKNIHEIEVPSDEKIIYSFYSALKRNFNNSENVFLFATSIEPTINVPTENLENDLFMSIIEVDYPDLATREQIFKDFIEKSNINIADDVSINRLAKDTIGENPSVIRYLIKEAQLYSLRQNHEYVTSSDFSDVIMKLSSGEKSFKMTEKERMLTAYHEAGHVIAGYFANPEYVLKRVEISPRSQGSLGLTYTDVDENKYSYFKEDFENMVKEFLGGLCAEELIYGSHTSGVVSDLAMATITVSNMVRAYGMSSKDALGIMQIVPDVTNSSYTHNLADKAIKTMLNNLLCETKKLMEERRPYLEKLANTLVEKEVVFGDEIKALFEEVDEELKASKS